MANSAYYELRVYGSKKSVERFLKITKGFDVDYSFSTFDQSDTYNQLCYCNDDRYYMEFFGEVKWGSEHLIINDVDKINHGAGKKIISWLTASKLLGLTMEWYCEECGSSFNEYFSVSNGVILRKDAIYWSYPGVFDDKNHHKNVIDFEQEVTEALENGIILDMSQVNAIRANNYQELEKTDCFSFGGYLWNKHSESEIKNMVEPIVNLDIRRL